LKIAISTDGDLVSAHFGRCPEFTILEIKDGQIVKREIIENPGHQPGLIPQFLHQKGIESIICGGMGQRAAGFFNELGIQTIVGVCGRVDNTIKELLAGRLTGGESLCNPGAGKGYGIEKTICDHSEENES
jgi:predicted Fe-Mo cluster-binding NifX family protein